MLLLGLDDTSFRDHLVYPKDLVDYGSKLKTENRWTTSPDDPVPPRRGT